MIDFSFLLLFSTTQMATFLMNGVTVIDLRISELIVLTFGLPATLPSLFYSANLAANLATILNVPLSKIVRVNIISATSDT